MARVPYLYRSDLTPEDQDLLARDINLNHALVNSPGAARSFSRLGGYIRSRSPLNPRLREMAILQVGYLARSEYEYSHHLKIARELGVSDHDIRAIAAETAGKETSLEPLSRAVLRAAREMTLELAIRPETWKELSETLANQELVDLVVTIGFYNGVVRILASLEVDLEDEYRRYLGEFPLPKS